MKFKKIAFLFPGQGAQTVGMGKDFYHSFIDAKEVFDEGESLLKYPIKDLIFKGPEDQLKETRYSQIAIFLTSLSFFRVVQKQFPHLNPYLMAGLSLGEYTALTASQRTTLADAVPLVHYRGQCMHESCETTKGTMAAILGLSSSSVTEMVAELSLPEDLWIANYNSPEQTVISGSLMGIEKAVMAAKTKGAKKILPLKVHGAFHSGLMQSAQDKLKYQISSLRLKDSFIKLVMNVTGVIVHNPEEIRNLLIEQVTGSVHWEKSMKTIQEEDVDLVLEIGPGKTLAGLAKQNGFQAPLLSINKIEDLELLNQLINE